MPAKSKAQLKLLFAKERRGEVPKGTGKRWAEHTPNIKKLPEYVHHKTAYAHGIQRALEDMGLTAKESEEAAEKEEIIAGKETRLRLDHKPRSFYGMKQHFKNVSPNRKR